MLEYGENEIIEGCKNNDPIFQEYLYQKKYSFFLKICARYAKDMQDAEQLLQDGFLKIFKKIDDFGYKGSFEGWMRRIMINHCLDFVKSKYYKEKNKIDYQEEVSENFLISNQNQGLQNLSLKELLKLIQTLPPMSRTVFNLFVFDGYSHKEISKILEMSEGTSQWHVNFARRNLQKKIFNLEQVEQTFLNNISNF